MDIYRDLNDCKKQLEGAKQYIRKLENVLANFAIYETSCQCCSTSFYVQNDNGRCSVCIGAGCYYDRQAEKWINGKYCPKYKSEKRKV